MFRSDGLLWIILFKIIIQLNNNNINNNDKVNEMSNNNIGEIARSTIFEVILLLLRLGMRKRMVKLFKKITLNW